MVIRDAIGEKLGMLMQFGAMFFSGFAVGFFKTWQLTLVIVAITPLLAAGGFMMMTIMADAVGEGLGAYAKAGSIAEETFSMIRTVVSYACEERQAAKYRKELEVAEREGIKKAKFGGLSMGFTMGVYFASVSFLVCELQLRGTFEARRRSPKVQD